MSRSHKTAALQSREAYWSVRTDDFNTLHERLYVIRDLINSITPAPRSLLDVGCGGGSLRRLLPASVAYYGVDITSRHFSAEPDPTQFQVADLDQPAPEAFGDTQFETVVCSGVFEYIAHCDGFLRFLRQKTAPVGHLILSFTNRQHYKDLTGWLTRRRRTYKDPHVNFMLIPDLVSALRAHGFAVLTHRTLTLGLHAVPMLGRFRRFPWSLFTRQFVFLCAARDTPRAATRRHRRRTARLQVHP